MNKIRFYIALWVAKCSVLALKITKHNGTNFPGIVALKICPDFLRYVKKPSMIIGITGTNGKTTITNLVTDAFAADGKKVLNNSLGSNIITGISTAFIYGVNIFGKCTYDTAVIEIDERSAARVFPYMNMDYLIINNLTRDSIMRNAHPEFIAKLLTEQMPNNTKLIINGDDLIACGVAPENERVYFGIDRMDTDINECINLINDMQICPKCHSKLKYEYLRYHHIGKAYCPECEFRSPDCDYRGSAVDLENMTMDITDKCGTHKYNLIHNSVFNIYNVVALVCLFREIGFSAEKTAELLSKINIVKSRYDVEEMHGYKIVRQMSKDKNALAASRVFDYLAHDTEYKELILIMNSMSDVRIWSENICWLYDADFEFLSRENIKNVIVAGPRAEDYYLRLCIAGVPQDRISVAKNELDAPNLLKLYDGESICVLYGSDTITLADNVIKNIKKVIEAKKQNA